MNNRLRAIKLALLAALLLAVGSASAYYDSNSYAPEPAKPTKVAAAAVAANGPMPPAIKATGDVLTDKNGMTLYTFDKDTAGSGKSACHGDCAASWPPLLAADAAKDTGDFTLAVRNDGRRQWAFKGKPLYLWSGDTKAGDTKGDGVGGVWHTAR
jgi:predicted lipoprotein with Yx(FWY)xxD motif